MIDIEATFKLLELNNRNEDDVKIKNLIRHFNSQRQDFMESKKFEATEGKVENLNIFEFKSLLTRQFADKKLVLVDLENIFSRYDDSVFEDFMKLLGEYLDEDYHIVFITKYTFLNNWQTRTDEEIRRKKEVVQEYVEYLVEHRRATIIYVSDYINSQIKNLARHSGLDMRHPTLENFKHLIGSIDDLIMFLIVIFNRKNKEYLRLVTYDTRIIADMVEKILEKQIVSFYFYLQDHTGKKDYYSDFSDKENLFMLLDGIADFETLKVLFDPLFLTHNDQTEETTLNTKKRLSEMRRHRDREFEKRYDYVEISGDKPLLGKRKKNISYRDKYLKYLLKYEKLLKHSKNR